ncbi:enoyl-CoA hydratase/carnithine racemase [Bradyrhizobium sp. LM2.9]
MTSFETILVERPEPAISRIVMNRPDARNAQNLQMTYDLNAAFDEAVQDDAVKVIILAGNGPHFSSGHDLRPGSKNVAGVDFPPIGNWGGFAEPNAHGRFAREQEIYLQITRRWRNLAKPTIAEVHGKCIAGGLMLAWICDLIVASDDAQFCDPVVTMGVCGVEWFVHPWELGPRKAQGVSVHRR